MKKLYPLILTLFFVTLHILGMTQNTLAIQLDGSNDYLVSGNDIFSNADLQSGSLVAWFKTSANFTQNASFVSYEGWVNMAVTPSGAVNGCTDGVCTFCTSPMALNDGNWHFAVLIWNGAIENKLYIDGVLVDQTVPTGAPNPNSTTGRGFICGQHPSLGSFNDYFQGEVDEVSIWGRQLTLAEIADLMNVCPAGAESGLLGYWKMESGGQSEPDLTINAHPLTLTNGPVWVTTHAPTCCDLETTVTQNMAQLTSLATGVAYQWVNCDSGYAPIPGANGSIYTATANGNYAVVVNDEDCRDTSACVSVTSVGMEEPLLGANWVVFPNPSGSVLNLDLGEVYPEITLMLTDLAGKQLRKRTYAFEQVISFVPNLPKGLYLLQVTAGRNHATLKWVME